MIQQEMVWVLTMKMLKMPICLSVFLFVVFVCSMPVYMYMAVYRLNVRLSPIYVCLRVCLSVCMPENMYASLTVYLMATDDKSGSDSQSGYMKKEALDVANLQMRHIKCFFF